jgi:hypothetical protein
LYGHHHCIALAFGLNVFCFHNLPQFDVSFDNSIFVGDLKLSQSVSWINWDGVVNLKRFGERVGVFLNGLDFSEFIFDVNFILVGNDGEQTFGIFLKKKVAARG